MMTKVFKGANVFMSRNLVPPEMFDSLHDALKHNGAEVFLCCDPSRNGPSDFHVIASREHEKFDDLRQKGCSMLGPQCVFSCAKERRELPKQEFTCCLAMDGVKVLASGFDMDEKVEIKKLVTAMGGILHAKASLDVNFVIAKNVLAAKYKWAMTILKKPIVNINWLRQCWKEHRVVPQESYRVLPFSGLTVCVTRIPADERKAMEKLLMQNGGKYSAELTKKCTHLVCDVPEGDKYKVARRWGHIHIVTRKWFDQSLARRACLSEDSYPVLGSSASSISTAVAGSMTQRSQDKATSIATDSKFEAFLNSGILDPDNESTFSQNMSSTLSDVPTFTKEDDMEEPRMLPKNDGDLDVCVADDSQNEDNNLYFSDCRIFLVGFSASEMRKLVNMIRRGGGSRHMSFNDKLTHIVVGTPSETEKRELRGLVAFGVIYVVRTTWLEDCDREKKECVVVQRHIAYDLLLPKEPAIGISGMNQGKSCTTQSGLSNDQLWPNTSSGSRMSQKSKEPDILLKRDNSAGTNERTAPQSQFSDCNCNAGAQEKAKNDSRNGIQDEWSSSVFKGKLFRFSSSFPENRRDEIILWVNRGGGKMVDDWIEKDVHFTIECHGVVQSLTGVTRMKYVTSHWIRSCLEDGHLLDVGSHIVYSPLPCQVPLPGFRDLHLCVSQYDKKERELLRNLCFTLGGKLVEKLSRKVTHLLCKFTSGPKYEAACKWGIQSATYEWLCECVKQNKVVAPEPFCPKEVTLQDREAGLCTMSQYPTQAVHMVSGENESQFLSQSQCPGNIRTDPTTSRSDCDGETVRNPSRSQKRARFLDDGSIKGPLPSAKIPKDPLCNVGSMENNGMKKCGEISNAVPDVAAAIEDLLEQTSKIQDQTSSEGTVCDKSLFPSDSSVPGQDHTDSNPGFVLSKRSINRNDKKTRTTGDLSGDVKVGIYDGFSETQTESQVVIYEEDLSGRQMIIDRVRTRSSMA